MYKQIFDSLLESIQKNDIKLFEKSYNELLNTNKKVIVEDVQNKVKQSLFV